MTGIIAEYNPFHNGHAYLIQKAKEITGCDTVAVIMSGNFVQRGAPAIYDKFIRARQALLNGADLVIELPAYISTASADTFARGAIDILNASGVIDSLCFGAETDNINALEHAASLPDTRIKELMASGMSYPKAAGINRDIISTPNNLLGVCYIKSLKQSGSLIKAYPVKRIGASHNNDTISGAIASAGAIRKAILSKNIEDIKDTVPTSAYEAYKSQTPHDYDKMSGLLQYILKTADINELKNIADISEGLENRIVDCASRKYLIGDIITEIKTKRYTHARISRAILHIMLNIKKTKYQAPLYIRALGFRGTSGVMQALARKSSLPVITNLKHAEKQLNAISLARLDTEVTMSDIYYLTNEQAHGKGYDYRAPIAAV